VSFLEQLGLEHPVLQAGMGGGLATAGLAGTVSAAGALGTVGILPPDELKAELRRADELARGRPVAANLLVPFTTRAHVEACGTRPVALHAGFDRSLVQQLKHRGATVLHTVGTVPQAKRALHDGADALIVQGIEAGGHLFGVEPALEALPKVLGIGTTKPVLAAGGIADHADVQRALSAGAAAVVAGTRFLLTEECMAHEGYKWRVLEATRTIETRLFGLGWSMWHRVVPNAATDRWCARDPRGPRAVRTLQSLSSPLRRLPMSVMRSTIFTQRPRLPLFGPLSPLTGMPDRLVDASALYAGETALRIDSIVPAAKAVALLAGSTIPPS
jgi:NAD(P)H-dependent flavin oxidoreductase YrpB (nitropropane dioxygenase family)